MDSDAAGSAITGAGTGAATGATVGGPWGAVIGAAVGLVGGLLGAQARNSAERRRKKFEGQMMGFQNEAQAGEKLAQGSQTAFANLMQGYRGIAGGG